jgi:hypothetical protein
METRPLLLRSCFFAPRLMYGLIQIYYSLYCKGAVNILLANGYRESFPKDPYISLRSL